MDQQILDLCSKGKNKEKFKKLFSRGDISDYNNDDSAADLALVSILAFFSQDAEQIFRLFQQSLLYKPQERKIKWEREDYRTRTINKAIQGQKDFYQPTMPRALHSVGFGEFLRVELSQKPLILDPILREQDIQLIYAPAGVGKTHLAMNMAYAISTGGSFLNFKAPHPRRVLYVDGEMPEIQLQERLAGIFLGNKDKPVPDDTHFQLLISTRQEFGLPYLDNTEGQVLLDVFFEKAEVIFLDNLSTLTAIAEQDAKTWLPIQEMLVRLRRQGKTIVLIHHSGKNGDFRGTSRAIAILDTVINLSHPKDYEMREGLRFEMRFQKARGVFGDAVASLDIKAEEKDGGLAPRKSVIRLLQIYDGIQSVFVFDLVKIGGIHTLPESLWKCLFISHNALFELKYLLHVGVIPQKLGCTLLVDRVLNGSRTKLKPELGLSTSAGLKDLAKELFSIDVSKKEQTSDWATPTLTPEQIEYTALDAILPIKIFQKQRNLLQSKRLLRPYEILRDAQHAIAHMEMIGIGFDISQYRKRIESWKRDKARLQKEIECAVRMEFNLNSGKQVGAWLNDILKEDDLASLVKTGTGKLSTSTPTLKLNEHMNHIFHKIVEYRHVAKKISSFGEGLYEFIDSPTNRLFGSFSLGTTSTGRMASQKPNLQNMPRIGFRDLFCAQEGYVLIGLDYSQQELRVVALVTGDKALLQIYEEGGDVLVNTAASILKIEKEAVTKPQRQLAKAVIFGLLYGQGAKGLARYARQQYGVEMTEEEAEQHRSALFHTYPDLREWQKATGNLVKSTGKIRTQCGRLRDFNREQEGYRFTAALNLPIQGAAAEVTLHAITRLTPFLSNEFRLVNVIHDEILLEIIESNAQEAAEKAKGAMEAAFLDVFPSAQPYLKNLVEAKIGKNWHAAK